jgi:hypothetical protein
MTSDEITRLLETFRKRYTADAFIDPVTVTLWYEQFRGVRPEIMKPAVLDYLANEESFPKPAELRPYLRKHAGAAPTPPASKPRLRSVPAVCEGCDHGWKESTERETRVGHRDGKPYEFTYPAGVHPCKACRPEQYDRWHDKWVPQALSNIPVRSTTVFTYNPHVMINQQRDMLAALKTAVKDPDDLDALEDLS